MQAKVTSPNIVKDVSSDANWTGKQRASSEKNEDLKSIEKGNEEIRQQPERLRSEL